MDRISVPVFRIIMAVFAAPVYPAPALGLSINAIFSDHMVLQRDVKVPVWGRALPGAGVSVSIAKNSASAITKADSTWKAQLPALAPGGPFDLRIISGDTIVITDVLVGDVWLCSGQSNMEMPVGDWGKVTNWEKEVTDAEYPRIRLFTMDHRPSTYERTGVAGSGWRICSPRSIRTFSAAAYFFGRDVQRRYNVSIGLIQSTWTGSFIESWMSSAALKQYPAYVKDLARVQKYPRNDAAAQAFYATDLAAWNKRIIAGDAGLRGAWMRPGVDTAGWLPISLPAMWEPVIPSLATFDGVVWFRRNIGIPASWAGKKAAISLGPVDDWDSTFFNGTPIGGLRQYYQPRAYDVPESLMKAGVATIAVRCVDTWSGGGLSGTPAQMYIKCGADSISLAGPWFLKPGYDAADDPMPQPLDWPHKPLVLFNGMIAPLSPYALRGVIWYQGESNADRAAQYRALFPAMIRDWRAKWGNDKLPFLFAQLAGYQKAPAVPGDDAWAELRDAQKSALSLPSVGMAVAIDVGDSADIHPKNKQAVGERLALAARACVYGDTNEYSGPALKGMNIEGANIRLIFDHAAGLTARNGDLRGFAVAGADRKWYWASASIEGGFVVVSCPQAQKPVAVRYGWASNPGCNLYNAAGLPASPFRTDSWPGITDGRNFLVK